jgi:hypothetical protein
MKYSKLNLGQIEAIVNKLGGYNGLQDFLSGKTEIIKKPEMVRKLPFIISLSEKSELKIIKSDIPFPASDGKILFSQIDACIKKTGYDGKGREPEIDYYSELNKQSYGKEGGNVAAYEFKQNGIDSTSLSTIFYKLFSLVDGDLSKISLNIDQMEHIVLNNKSFITEIAHWPNIFFVKADHKIFPVSIVPQPGGYGEVFDTHVHHFGEMSCYRRARFFVPFN